MGGRCKQCVADPAPVPTQGPHAALTLASTQTTAPPTRQRPGHRHLHSPAPGHQAGAEGDVARHAHRVVEVALDLRAHWGRVGGALGGGEGERGGDAVVTCISQSVLLEQIRPLTAHQQQSTAYAARRPHLVQGVLARAPQHDGAGLGLLAVDDEGEELVADLDHLKQARAGADVRLGGWGFRGWGG